MSKDIEPEIREVTPESWRELRDLYLKLLKSDPEAFADTYEEIASLGKEDWKKDLGRSGATFVATDADKFVGMGRINFYDELPGVPVLHKLGVFPEYRGKGIAQKLIEAREGWARSQGAEKVRLYVMAVNKAAIEFPPGICNTAANHITRKDAS
jgi:ribosomal protein S18 acetylase RimI-like enzyme